MRVVVDARQVFRPDRRGIGKITTQLYGALAARRPGWRFVLVHRNAVSAPELAPFPNVRAVRLDPRGADRLDLWERLVLPAAAAWHRADLLHSPANTGPPRATMPRVIHVHDLIPLDLDGDQAWAERVRRSAATARRVLTASDHARGRIIDALGVPAGRVAVVPWGPDPHFRRTLDPTAAERCGLPPGAAYLFAFGAADRRKNTATLITAFAGLPAGARGGTRLLLAGVQPAAADGFRKQAVELGVGDAVTVAGYTPAADVPALLSGAVALLFPSSAEGFGLPVLEGFACGVPVLTGDSTSLPEVAGDAALTVTANDPAAVRRGMETLLTDPALRADLAARGGERLKQYSWERTAEATAREFEAAAGRERS